MLNYFQMTLKYCLNKEEQKEVISRINEIFIDFNQNKQDSKFDIMELAIQLCPLDFKLGIFTKKKKKQRK